MRGKTVRRLGVAVVGAGRVGTFRAQIAARHPAVDWIGLAERVPERGEALAQRIGADYVTTDFRELLARPEVTCVVVATDEHLHADPVLAAVERRLPLLVEKPLATTLRDSARILRAIEESGVDAVVGYTQRFRRRWLAAKEKCRTGALGEVTLVTARAFLNRLVALDNYRRTDDPTRISPMVISGTHALDLCLWFLEGKTAVEVHARAVDRVLGPLYSGIDATVGTVVFDDGTLLHMAVSWALPVTWPGAVYSVEVGIVGTEGVLTVDDTHRDVVLAVSAPQMEGYNPHESRLVDFLGSYPPGDVAFGELWGPMRDETVAWLDRVSTGVSTPHATAAEAHHRLMVSKAFDLSARKKAPVSLPLLSEDEAG
ncbi:MAG: Gfo/Idh/MocA family oxidoreductase [Armatimonadota bacterium]|nr:Gfo/Idh/MocA family oxidoreductase [Armatimonadota bacterium]MDR5688451.1 Gfo/Idh/MocA family oxidoreductase [Armatimonadota bacterium]MDR7386619.1 Gfo/Idh/MocA family oxidoreductase [Armatimonadota bacterium]MDR7388968.1 Gfo/Idh/MocA family oxidoreductase [Armatimonadota bacterium]MDR7395828.1 Gfo/Idh/MocA family oxidoreductase [Armatimonadota bacterium]